MKIQQVCCPGCGANLKIEDGRKDFYCSHCGSAIHIEDEVERKEYTIHTIHEDINHADIAKTNAMLEFSRIQAKEEREDQITSRILLIIIAVILVGCMIAFFYLTNTP